MIAFEWSDVASETKEWVSIEKKNQKTEYWWIDNLFFQLWTLFF